MKPAVRSSLRVRLCATCRKPIRPLGQFYEIGGRSYHMGCWIYQHRPSNRNKRLECRRPASSARHAAV